MRRISWVVWGAAACGLVAAWSCGGSSGSSKKSQGGSPDGSTGPKVDGAGGSGGSADSGAAGGSAGSGGSGGSAGTGVPDAAPNPCQSPNGQTTLCVKFNPENITLETEAALDGKGDFFFHVFDIPNPPGGSADDQIALYVYKSRKKATDPQLSVQQLSDLVVTTSLPPVVYVRAIFVDNPAVYQGGGQLKPGTWLGGFDGSGGLTSLGPLIPVPIRVGQGNALTVDLTALRRLSVTMKVASGTPLVGDGQGPLTAIAFAGNIVGPNALTLGYGTAGCQDLSGGQSVTVEGVAATGGPYWVTGVLNDFGLAGGLPPGSVSSFIPTAQGARVPNPNRLDPGTDYTPSISIELNYVSPIPADAGATPNSCADFMPADGGSDAASDAPSDSAADSPTG